MFSFKYPYGRETNRVAAIKVSAGFVHPFLADEEVKDGT